jgi:hypothetical protein
MRGLVRWEISLHTKQKAGPQKMSICLTHVGLTWKKIHHLHFFLANSGFITCLLRNKKRIIPHSDIFTKDEQIYILLSIYDSPQPCLIIGMIIVKQKIKSTISTASKLSTALIFQNFQIISKACHSSCLHSLCDDLLNTNWSIIRYKQEKSKR